MIVVIMMVVMLALLVMEVLVVMVILTRMLMSVMLGVGCGKLWQWFVCGGSDGMVGKVWEVVEGVVVLGNGVVSDVGTNGSNVDVMVVGMPLVVMVVIMLVW